MNKSSQNVLVHQDNIPLLIIFFFFNPTLASWSVLRRRKVILRLVEINEKMKFSSVSKESFSKDILTSPHSLDTLTIYPSTPQVPSTP